MITTLRFILCALVLTSLLSGCAASNGGDASGTTPQYSAIEQCARSGGIWRSGACEPASSGGGGGY